MKRIFLVLLLVILLITGCVSTSVRVASIRIKGSDTMLHLTDLLAQAYMEQHSGISIYVDGGGTASGVRSLIRGEIDICTASRNLEPEEVKLLADNFGSIGISYLIAKDGLCIYLNPENPVNNFTKNELTDIFMCNITNWNQVGGPDKSISLIIRNPNSGTYLYFKEHLLEGKEYCDNATIAYTTENVIDQIKRNRFAVGYGGVAFKSEIKLARIDNILPTEENIRNDRYPVTRYLHFYTLNQPTGAVKDFIDWVLGPAGQKIIKNNGFVSLFEINY
jgi:phosphate transport system substrate-binding protein